MVERDGFTKTPWGVTTVCFEKTLSENTSIIKSDGVPMGITVYTFSPNA